MTILLVATPLLAVGGLLSLMQRLEARLSAADRVLSAGPLLMTGALGSAVVVGSALIRTSG